MSITIHINAQQPHHWEHAQWWTDGLRKHGIELKVTSNIFEEADTHIITGPHYGYDYWVKQDAKVIWLDRALWNEEKFGKWKSMDYVSLGWLRKDGGRTFAKSRNNAEVPCIQNRCGKSGIIYLAEFRENIDRSTVDMVDDIRYHPDEKKHVLGFEDHVTRFRRAIGKNTTALVQAGLLGLEVKCFDPRNVMYEGNWLDILPFTDWHYSDIQTGEAWEHLRTAL